MQMRAIWKSVRPDVVNVQGIDLRAAYCANAGLHPLVVTAWGADINDLFDTNFADAGYHERLASMLGAGYYVTEDKPEALNRYKRRIGESLRRVDLVTAVTPQILRRCDDLAGRKLPQRIFRYGVDFDVFHAGYEVEARKLRESLRIKDGAKVLLSVRTLQPLFGHQQILEAFGELVSDSAMPETVLVCQEKHTFESELDDLRQSVSAMKLDDRVFWLPADLPAESLPVQYALADVVVNYPTQDGFPVSLLEAAACRRPVITSDLEAYEGTYGDSMVRVPTGDSRALSAAMKRVLTEAPAERDARVAKAYFIAREIGDQERNFAQLFADFDALRHKRPAFEK